METFNSDGVEIAYLDEGTGDPVLLIHGFASNVATNWVDTGWVKSLTGAGYRVIAYDNRGHGHSEKLYRLEDYGAPIMAEDARRLLAHLGILRARHRLFDGRAHRGIPRLAHPGHVRSLVFGGLGINMVRGVAGTGPVAHALEAASIDEVTNPTARTFRAFAEQPRRSQGARRLHSFCPRAGHAGGARRVALSGAGCRRREGCNRWLGDGACRPHSRRARDRAGRP